MGSTQFGDFGVRMYVLHIAQHLLTGQNFCAASTLPVCNVGIITTQSPYITYMPRALLLTINFSYSQTPLREADQALVLVNLLASHWPMANTCGI